MTNDFDATLGERLAQLKTRNEELQRNAPEHLKLTPAEMADIERDQVLMEATKLANELNGSTKSPFDGMGIEMTRLQGAVYGRSLARVKMALLDGDDVNDMGAFGMSALHIAASRGDMRMVQLLLYCGADASLRTSHGETPLDMAVSHDRTDIADLLRSLTHVPKA